MQNLPIRIADVPGRGAMLRLLAGVIASLVVVPTLAVAQPASRSGAGREPALVPDVIVVGPFANISAEVADDWIGAGIAETVSADLERLEAISVIGREAFEEEVLAVGGDRPAAGGSAAERAMREVGRRLGAAWLVTGGYQRLGDRMRITARLVDTGTGAVAASFKSDGRIGEIFALQDRIVGDLGAALAARTSGGDRAADARVSGARPMPPGNGNGTGNGNGNGGGSFGRAPQPGPVAPVTGAAGSRSPDRIAGLPPRTGRGVRLVPSDPSGTDPAASGELASEDVSGGIVVGGPRSGGPRSGGFAAAAGILTGRPTLRPTRTDTRPEIDGRLDDAVWRNALQVTEFVQQQPLEGAPATEDTDLWISYDSQNLYLAFHAHYRDPGIMRASRVDRDRAFRDDNITVYFDPFLDQQRAYAFSVNGYGVQGDQIVSARGRGGGRGGGGRGGRGGGGGSRGIPFGDNSWDALFDSGAQIVGDGFTAEMAIPFKSLRYPRRGRNVPHRWAFQVVREIRGKDENVVWAPISRGMAGFLPQMGLLEGMTSLSTSRNLEIMPVATGIQFGSLDTSSGDFTTGDANPEGGVNVKYGITSNLTADFTLNPDFSQIESDRPQIEVNQRFALFYPELRPVLSRGRRDLQRVRAHQLRAHADHQGPGLGCEGHRQGGADVGRVSCGERCVGRVRRRSRGA